MIWTIPNILTMGRILAAPCLALVFLVFDRPLADWVALVLFTVAALTDFVDGWLARRLHQQSALGKMLDPIADKVMVIIALMILVAQNPQVQPLDGTGSLLIGPGYIAIPAALIILREVLVSGLREFLGDVKLHVTQLAKWKTAAQLLAIGAFLGIRPVAHLTHPMSHGDDLPFLQTQETLLDAAMALLWVAAILTLVTGWDYFRKAMPYLRDREDG